jgi:hypothetical protein
MTVRVLGTDVRVRRVAASRDEGASAVEFALVSLLLITLLFGIIEFSLLLRDNVSVSSAVRSAARIASAGAGSGPGTCPPVTPTSPPCTPASSPKLAQDAADAVQRTGTALPEDSIDELWVYKANAQGFPGSFTSMTGASCTTNCVRFRWQDSSNRFVYVGGSWASTSIAACAGNNADGTAKSDAVGVYIRATHRYLTGLFGATQTVSDRAVMQFEPLPNDSCRANLPVGGGGHP